VAALGRRDAERERDQPTPSCALQHHRRVDPAVRGVPGGAEQEGGAEGEHVTGGPDLLATRLLGGHVLRCPDHGARGREPAGGITQRRHPEIAEVGPSIGVEEHVGGLDVAVHDPVAMRLGERGEEGIGDEVDLAGRQGAVVSDLLGQGAAREVRQHEDDVVAVVHHVEERDDVRVPELRERGRLASDALAGLVHLVGAAVQQQALAGHQAPGRVDRQVDHTHAPAPEPALHHVLHGRTSLRARCALQAAGHRDDIGRPARDPGSDVAETHLSQPSPYDAMEPQSAAGILRRRTIHRRNLLRIRVELPLVEVPRRLRRPTGSPGRPRQETP
jgi:hypothetical protein